MKQEVRLGFAHQSPIMRDPGKERCERLPFGNLGIDTGPAVFDAMEWRHLVMQPNEVENPIDANQNMIVRDQVSERARHGMLQLSPLLASQHRTPQADIRSEAARGSLPDVAGHA